MDKLRCPSEGIIGHWDVGKVRCSLGVYTALECGQVEVSI